MKVLTSLIFLLFLLPGSIYGQGSSKAAYIISNDADTLFGAGNMGPEQDFCLFREIGSDDARVYNPDEISAFRYINGKYYVSKQIKNKSGEVKWCFLEFLVDGEIDLFRIRNAHRYFIKRDNQDLLELDDRNTEVVNSDGRYYLKKNRTFNGLMRYYMSDAHAIFPEIDKIEDITQKSMVKIAIDYHNIVCKDAECINYTKSISKFIVSWKLEAVSGATYHNAYYSPYYGLQVHLGRKENIEHMFLKTGLIYSDKIYWAKDNTSSGERQYKIRIPLSFQYVFCKGVVRPTVAIGWPSGFLINLSVQAGVLLSISKQFEIALNGSVDGLHNLMLDRNQEYFNNDLAHTFSFGVIYNFSANKE
ncbi:MAG TPA: hypothetical protein PLR01_00175 [Bacteroidales bacterium]|nr:hypothetical protein [Bacteroidales bacterium]